MTGYLDRLAARSLGAPPAAAPRPRSLFEDAPEAAPGTSALRGTGSIPDAHAPRVPGGSPPVRPVVAAPLPASSPVRPPLAEEPAEAPADRHSGRETGTTERMPEPPADGGARHPALAGDSQPEIPAVRTSAATVSAEPNPVAVAAARRAEGEPVRVRPARAEATGARADGPAPEPAAPDVIHVTIGRVEVRASIAASPAAPVPRAQPAERVLSLHDYLRGERAR